jgi:hypothetical protein
MIRGWLGRQSLEGSWERCVEGVLETFQRPSRDS